MDKLETLVENSRGLVGGHKLVDEKRMQELLEQLRFAVPQDVNAAQDLLKRKDALIRQAQSEAKETRAVAEEEFKSRIDENEVVLAARARADELLEDAQTRSARMIEQAEAESGSKRGEADAYAIQVLRDLERELANITGSVKKGMDLLSPSSAVGAR